MSAALVDRPWSRSNPRQRLPWLGIVVALHLLAVLALWHIKVRTSAPEWGAITTLRLLSLEPAQTRPSAPHSPRATPRPRPPAPQLPSFPFHMDAAPTTPNAPPPDTAPTPVEPRPITPPPLNLRLPDAAASAPPTLRSQVLNDPRVVSRPSYGQRFADTLGTDTAVREDRLNDGSVRIRQGTSCVILKESPASRLDPFSQTYMPAPRMAGKCPE